MKKRRTTWELVPREMGLSWQGESSLAFFSEHSSGNGGRVYRRSNPPQQWAQGFHILAPGRPLPMPRRRECLSAEKGML